MADDTIQKIQFRQADFQRTFARMDVDRELRFNKEYVMKDAQGRTVRDAINVTLNDAMTYGDMMAASLNTAKIQPDVQAETLDDKQKQPIEGLFNALFVDGAVDRRLQQQNMNFREYIADQELYRGRMVARIWLHKDNGVFVPDIMPVDARYFVHDEDVDGQTWGASFMERGKDQVLHQYPKAVVSGRTAVVTEYIDRTMRKVYIGAMANTLNTGNVATAGQSGLGVLIHEEEHNLVDRDGKPYCPYQVTLSSLGSQFADKDAFEHRGESIFWPVRKLYPQLNRIATIDQTTMDRAFTGSYQREVQNVNGTSKPQSPYTAGQTIEVEKGGMYQLIPINDIQQANLHGWNIVDSHKQQGSVSTVDQGQLGVALPASGIRLLLGPKQLRVENLARTMGIFFQGMFDMSTWQFIQFGMVARVGRPGSRVRYSGKDFKQEYYLSVKFFIQDPLDDIANASQAEALGDLVSDDTKRRSILKLENPDQEDAKVKAQQAEQAVPVLALYNRCVALIETDQDMEARIVQAEILNILEQQQLTKQAQAQNQARKFEQNGPEPVVERQAPQASSPLVGAGRGGRVPAQGGNNGQANRQRVG